jgi:hypothetical protein
MIRTASCSCGQLQARCDGDPAHVSMCHCLACQRRSGSVFAIQARFARERVTVSGRASDYVLVGDGGGRATFHFCPVCGATVYYELDSEPAVLALPVGAFADPAFPPPTRSVYEVRRHAWVALSGITVEHWD